MSGSICVEMLSPGVAAVEVSVPRKKITLLSSLPKNLYLAQNPYQTIAQNRSKIGCPNVRIDRLRNM